MKVSSFSLDFNTAEETFSDYPTLLYDGPFADAVLNKESEIIKNAKEKTKDECKKSSG
ncbi:MAG: germination protein YpeB [Clostridiales bacterium]|nr:germination protein YpeB [Clostridiales bacterium]